jgi:phosphotransferase system IIA component
LWCEALITKGVEVMMTLGDIKVELNADRDGDVFEMFANEIDTVLAGDPEQVRLALEKLRDLCRDTARKHAAFVAAMQSHDANKG